MEIQVHQIQLHFLEHFPFLCQLFVPWPCNHHLRTSSQHFCFSNHPWSNLSHLLPMLLLIHWETTKKKGWVWINWNSFHNFYDTYFCGGWQKLLRMHLISNFNWFGIFSKILHMRLLFNFLSVHYRNVSFAFERNWIWNGFITGFNCEHFKSVHFKLAFPDQN